MKLNFSYLSASLFTRIWGVWDRDLSAFCVASALRELSLPREKLDQLIFSRLKNIVTHANDVCPHYTYAFNRSGVCATNLKSIDDLKFFPYLTRDILKESISSLTASGMSQRGWSKSATGGTTSSPIVFFRNSEATCHKNAASKAINTWFGWEVGNRVAFLWGAPQDFATSPTIGMKLRNLTAQRTLMLPSAPLDDEVFFSHLKKMDIWRPVFLQAYPTPLYEFCLYLKKIGKRMPYLKSASVTAEPLYNHQRKLIEEVLGFKVFNWYGSRELGRVASECKYHNGLHINEPSVFVEIEPDPDLPDNCGHLIITDLLNTATPLIRYKTGDIAKFVEGECQCGRSLKRIARIEGRLVDTIVLAGGRKVPGVSLTNRVIKDCAEVAELQVVQKSLDTFLLRYVKGSAFSSVSLDSLAGNLKSILDADVSVLFEEVAELPRSASGKVRFVISEVASELQPEGGDNAQLV